MKKSEVAPITSRERVGELDVLRGFALFGVIVVNIATWIAPPGMVTEAQHAAVTASALDGSVEFAVHWLGYDKANTLFALLFGLGFYVQMERLESKRADADRIYLRRLWVLLALGTLHIFFIWPFDVLQIYAIAGFALFALRRKSDRFLLVVGLLLALFGKPVQGAIAEASGLSDFAAAVAYSDEAIMARQTADSVFELAGLFAHGIAYEWFIGTLIVGWFFYSLGRFLIGAYIARKGWLQNSGAYLPTYSKIARVCLPLGLALEWIYVANTFQLATWYSKFDGVAGGLHVVSAPILTAGYLAVVVLAYHSFLKTALSLVFASVGRMALTNYVAQSFFIGWVAYQAMPGPALAGVAGPATLVGWAVAFFVLQIVVSALWLRVFAFGPLEWVWRSLTYGTRPAFRRHERQARLMGRVE